MYFGAINSGVGWALGCDPWDEIWDYDHEHAAQKQQRSITRLCALLKDGGSVVEYWKNYPDAILRRLFFRLFFLFSIYVLSPFSFPRILLSPIRFFKLLLPLFPTLFLFLVLPFLFFSPLPLSSLSLHFAFSVYVLALSSPILSFFLSGLVMNKPFFLQ